MKLFHKIATSLLGATMALGVGFALANSNKEIRQARADTVNFELSSASSVSKSGVNVSFSIGDGSTSPTWYDAGLRLYASNTVTVSSDSTIVQIAFNWEKQGSKAFASVTASVGTYDHPTNTGVGTWTGSAQSIIFTLGGSGQLQLNTFSVTTGALQPSISLDKEELTLKTNSEPAVVTVTPNAAFTATPTVTTTNVPEFIQTSVDGLAVTVTPKAAGTGSFKIVATNNTEVAEKTVTVSISEPFVAPTEGAYYINVTHNSTKYYLKSGGSSASPTAVTDRSKATLFILSSAGEADTFYIKDVNDNYLYTFNDSKGVRVGSTEDTWLFTEGTADTGAYDMKSSNSNRYLTFYASNSDFRCYSNAGDANRHENTDLEAVPILTAEQFAQDLLDQTDAICNGYVEGDNNHDALLAIWNNLSGVEKYQIMEDSQKAALHDAQANEEGTTIQQAMARYDHICKAYKLSNFIDRDSAKSGSNSMNSVTMDNNNVVIILVVSSVVTISLVGLFFVARRRKHQ